MDVYCKINSLHRIEKGIVTLETNNKRYVQVQRFGCFNDSLSDDVTLHNATEDVDKDRFHLQMNKWSSEYKKFLLNKNTIFLMELNISKWEFFYSLCIYRHWCIFGVQVAAWKVWLFICTEKWELFRKGKLVEIFSLLWWKDGKSEMSV